MKLRYIFTVLAAVLTFAFTGCQEPERFLNEVKVSSSYVAIPVAGGQTQITVNAVDSWAIAGVPEWLTVTPTSGSAGESTVTFSAAATAATNEAVLTLVCAGAEQTINVIQMAEKVELAISPISDVLKAESGNFRIKGEVYGIYNTTYGNFYMKDETGSILIYGCLDASGAEKNFSSLGIENGDIIDCEGPLTIYNGTYELVNITVNSIEKSLIKVDEVVYVEVEEGEDPVEVMPIEGGQFKVLLTCKGDGVAVNIPEDAKSWLTVAGIALEGETATVTFEVPQNDKGDRDTEVTFSTTKDGKTYSAVAPIAQKGSIVECSIADFLKEENGSALFKLTGKVADLVNTSYGNFHLVDATGSVYVYGLTATKVEKNDKSFSTLGIQEGDIVTLIGTRAEHNGTAQVGGPAYYVSHVGHTEATVTEFLAKETGDTWCKLTGTVANIKNETYGNFDLIGEDGASVHVYGLTVAPVAKNDKSFSTIGIKEGDTLTLIGTRSEHNGTAQVSGPAYYISHETPAPAPEPVAGLLVLDAEDMPAEYVKEGEDYAASTITVDGYDFEIFTVANYGSGIQFRKEGGYIESVTVLDGLNSVKLIFNPDKSFYPSNLQMTSGDAVLTPTIDEDNKTVVYDFPEGSTGFTLTNTSGYAVYLSSIELTLPEE